MRAQRVVRLAGACAVLVVVTACGDPVPAVSGGGAPDGSDMNTGVATDTMGGANLDVRLESVAGSRPGRATPGRNPFRFGSQPSQLPGASQGGADAGPGARVGPAPVEPQPSARRSPLRFIGTVEAPSAGLIAVFTDGEVVFHGRQGETVEGRYRIIDVSLDRVEVELLPMGGRQVLALDGL